MDDHYEDIEVGQERSFGEYEVTEAELPSSRGLRRGNPPIGFGEPTPFGSTPHSEGPGDISEDTVFRGVRESFALA